MTRPPAFPARHSRRSPSIPDQYTARSHRPPTSLQPTLSTQPTDAGLPYHTGSDAPPLPRPRSRIPADTPDGSTRSSGSNHDLAPTTRDTHELPIPTTQYVT